MNDLLHVIPFLDSFALCLFGICCVVHINSEHRLAWCIRIGYALVIGGAFGAALEYWWPSSMVNFLAEKILHAGLALLALGYARDELRSATNRVFERLGL